MNYPYPYTLSKNKFVIELLVEIENRKTKERVDRTTSSQKADTCWLVVGF